MGGLSPLLVGVGFLGYSWNRRPPQVESFISVEFISVEAPTDRKLYFRGIIYLGFQSPILLSPFIEV